MKVGPRPYPSKLNVRGFKHGTVRQVQVTLHGFTHQVPSTVFLLLVSPAGRSTLLMGGIGDGDPVEDLTIVLSDNAATPLPETVPPPWVSGIYQPANYGGPWNFSGALPKRPVSAADLTVFNGTDPAGVWKLYAEDVNSCFAFGEITRG